MAAQRKLDIALDSVKRLLQDWRHRQPGEPAAEAASRRPRPALLRASRQGASRGVLGPRRPQRAAGDGGSRRAGPGGRAPSSWRLVPPKTSHGSLQEVPVRRRRGAHRPSAGRALGGGPRTDPAQAGRRRREPARLPGADRRPHHEPERLRAERRHDGGRSHHRAPDGPRRRDGLLSLRRRRAPAPRRRRLAAAPAARAARHAAQADHDDGSISARVDMDQEEVARLVASYNLLAIPVVDAENKLVGIITVDDVIDVIKDEATEDVYRLAGVAGDERVFTPPDRVAATSGCHGCRQPRHGVPGGVGRGALRGHDRRR